ncbi:hypothetical protein ACGC1H_003824 [Rhizoctonia solani]|uniref:TRIP4/RQT4 C2HC5-type zinc finger domain-containing protein n=1 Tax=Rhizoctonia solani TaxID=456999 RepID=A0A8H3C0L2_9AGAM|nr:unnamed protein product [Rhizoctonia solani]
MSKNKSTSTAWAGKKQGGGSLTSDLLTPRRQSPAPAQSQPKRPKGQASPAGFPKSAEVKKLERLIDEVSTGVVDSRVANRPGCFCLARTHALSRHVPICVHCGIVLCSLHNPALPCPSCSSPLLPPAARNALLLQLQEELAVQLQREDEKLAEEMRMVKEIELHRSGGGSFPTLTGQPEPKPAQNAPRKVLSIGSSGKRPTLSTFIVVPSPATSNPNSGRTSPAEERIPPPPHTATFVELDPESKLLLRQRPWVDLRDPTPMYQPQRLQQQSGAEQVRGEGSGRGKKRGRGRGRGGGNDGARTVPGAGN